MPRPAPDIAETRYAVGSEQGLGTEDANDTTRFLYCMRATDQSYIEDRYIELFNVPSYYCSTLQIDLFSFGVHDMTSSSFRGFPCIRLQWKRLVTECSLIYFVSANRRSTNLEIRRARPGYLDISVDAPSRLNPGYRQILSEPTMSRSPEIAQAFAKRCDLDPRSEFSKRCLLDPRFGTKCRK
jgi:hypothetical protein